MDIGTRIKDLRNEKNLTQTKLGEVIGVEKSTVSMYENGNSTPNDDIKKMLANFFNVSLDYLLGVSDIKNPYKESKELPLTKKDINEIDPDLRAIQRAREKMTPEQKDKMMKVLNAAFDDFFEDK